MVSDTQSLPKARSPVPVTPVEISVPATPFITPVGSPTQSRSSKLLTMVSESNPLPVMETCIELSSISLVTVRYPRSQRNSEEPAATTDVSVKTVSPQQLSEWIIAGRNDYQLIDIRSEKEYNAGYIKTAENIPLKTLLQRKTIEQELNTDELIVLYSNGNSHAHQCWVVLKSSGIDCYVLQGGYNHWNKAIMNPSLPADSSEDEILRYKRSKSVSNHFGGSTVSDVDSGNKVKKKKIFKKRKKGKLEGC